MCTRKPWKGLHSEGREIIAKLIAKCDEEQRAGRLVVMLSKSTERAAAYSGVSRSTIKTIRKENKFRKENNPEKRLKTPGKKRKRRNLNDVRLDYLDQCVIRNTVQDYYIREKKVPPIHSVLPIIQEKIYFPWGRTSLYRVIRSMGFKWRRCQSKQKLLFERPDVVERRSRYFVKMKQFREGRSIFFIDETWIDCNLKFRKCWQGKEVDTEDDINRLVILLVCSSNGLLPNSLLMYMSACTTEEYHGGMNSSNFERWTVKQLLPNLPPLSVVVLENEPYNSVQIDKPPSPYSVKKDMISWLHRKGVHCNEEMRKTDLYRLIQPIKPKEKVYKFDTILSGNGHTVLRLPPYMSELNPVKSVWCKLKSTLTEQCKKEELILEEVFDMTQHAIKHISEEDWNQYNCHVQLLEEEYSRKDGIVADVIDDIVMSINSGSESEGEKSSCASSCSSEDSDFD